MKRQFEIKSGRMVISDPCYELNSIVNATIDNVKNGKWGTIVIHSDDNRIIESLVVFNIESSVEDESLLNRIQTLIEEENSLPNFFGVDSGQFGFFDFKGYGNYKRCKNLKRYSKIIIESENPFYSICCDIVSSEEGWGILPFGVVCSSGRGDGLYEVYGLKNSDEEYILFFVDFNFYKLF